MSEKHDGSLPLVGVNTFLPAQDINGGRGEVGAIELMRSSEDENYQQVASVETFRDTHAEEAAPRLTKLQQVARERRNTFEALMEAAKVCSLGFHVTCVARFGGEYRRNM